MRLKADLTLFLVAFIWGTAFISQNIAGQHHLAFLYNGASFSIAALILFPFIRLKKIPPEQWKWMGITGLVLFVASASQQLGIIHTQIANAGFLTSLYTVFTPFLLWVGFRERPHWVDALAVLAASAGAYLLSTGGNGLQFQNGDSLEVLGALFWGVHVVLLGKFASRFDPVSFAAGQFAVNAVLSLLTGLALENPAQILPLPVIGAILYRAVLSIGFGYTLQVWGQNHTPPTDAALILGLEAVVAAIVGWLLLGQTLILIQIFGCVVIFLAVMFSQLKGLLPAGRPKSAL